MQYVGLHNCISSPTRYGPTRHSLLDLILVKECSVVNSEVIGVYRTISDHNGVLVNIDVKINFKNSYNREIWDYKRGDFGKLNHSIGNFNWYEFLLDSNNVHLYTKLARNLIKHIFIWPKTVFPPALSQLDLMINPGLIQNYEEKLEKEIDYVNRQ